MTKCGFRKFMVIFGSLTEYYTTEEEAVREALEDANCGIRTPNKLYKYNEKTDKFEVIGTFYKADEV